MTTINIDDCAPIFKAVPSYESPRLIENISLTLQHPEAGTVGEIAASKIRRSGTRGQLLYALDAESDELLQFGTKVIDKYGRFRPWLVENDYHKGTGCWGTQIDENKAPILYISDVSIPNPELREKGFGSTMLRLLFRSGHLWDNGFAACWPVPDDEFMRVGTNEAEIQTEQERVNHFFRLNGFRRIGRTQFFGYSPNPSHPSRLLPIENDIDPEPNLQQSHLVNPFLPPEPEILPVLHTAVARDKTPSVATTIHAARGVDPTSLSAQDQQGLRPIYVAVAAENLPAVRALLSSGVREDLFKRDNVESMTPLEECAKTMKATRDFSETLIGDWNGYSDESLLIKAALKRAMGHEMPSTDEEYAKERKYGCSCGRCVAGWLSPKMQFRLGDFVYDSASISLMTEHPAFRPREVLTPLEASTEMSLDYIPRHLFPNLYKTFFKGYVTVFQAVSAVLGRSGPQRGNANNYLSTCIPTPMAVLTTQAVNFYLQKGGRVEYALDAITHRSKDMSPLGDGEFDSIWDEVSADPEDDEGGVGQLWRSLPRCDNDLEFDLVRRKLGLNPDATWGPYYLEEEQIMGGFGHFGHFGDEDEDEDDDEITVSD
ncbi:hypothetical protein BU15DRAFT_41028 [Melanogaster broomeanus]|nr:hypothetical protein BU15DRAFT_41028 [Melanogaster broomeanus]